MRIRTIRSDRRTVSIEVRSGDEVVVRCPRRMTEVVLKAILKEKEAWIQTKTAEMRARQSRLLLPEPGEVVLFGQCRRLVLSETARPAVVEGQLVAPRAYSAERLDRYFRSLLERYISKEIPLAKADLHALVPERSVWPSGAFRLRKMKRRWGSCSANGDLLFNAQLVQASPESIRYVVRHELAHWVHFDHSKDFRALEKRLVGGSDRLAAAKADLARISLNGQASSEIDDLL